MREKKPFRTLIATVIVLTIVFAVSEALAQACPNCLPIAESCPLVDSKGNPTSYVISIVRDTSGQWPWPPGNGGTSYAWVYRLSSAPSQQNQLCVLAPACCPQTVYTVPTGGAVYCPGEGDPTTKWGFGIGFEYVIRMAYASPNAYSFYTDRPLGIRNTSMQLKSGNSIYYAKSIAGPAATGGVGALAQTECITLETGQYPISMSLIRNQSDGYADPYSVKFYESTDCSGTPEYPTISRPEPLVYCTGGSGQRNECIKLEKESPGCVDYYIQGTLCRWCW